jgi:ABC-type transport system substrate-binding protein
MRVKLTALLIGSALGLTAAQAGSLDITNCDLAEFSYRYTVANADFGVVQIGSLSDETINLAPSTVDNGTATNEHDFTDEMPDRNIFVTLIDGDEITTRICSDGSAQ